MFVFKATSRDVWLLVLVIVMALAANLPEDLAAAFHIDKTYLLMALTGVIAVSILRYLRFTLVLVTVVLAAGANLPAELAARFNIDPSIMFFTLVVMVVAAAVNRFVNVVPEAPALQPRQSVHGARALIKAISNGQAAQVRRLIDSGVNINVATLGGKTPLMLATFTGNADIVALLIEAGADVQARDRDGNTAHDIAARRGLAEIESRLAGLH